MIGRLLDVVLRFSCFAKSAFAGDLVVRFAFVSVGLGVAFSALAETSHAKNLSTQTPWISSTIPPQFPHQLSDLKAINTAAETELASRTQPKTLQFSKRGGLVVYWASWCSICKTQIEKIRRIQNELRQCDMNVVDIAIEEDPTLFEVTANRSMVSMMKRPMRASYPWKANVRSAKLS